MPLNKDILSLQSTTKNVMLLDFSYWKLKEEK